MPLNANRSRPNNSKNDTPENIQTPRRLLRLLNGLRSDETDGLAFLSELFNHFLRQIALDPKVCVALHQTYEAFFAKAESHYADAEGAIPRDVESFRRLFNHPSGVVINTCHGVKGEEYHTVIAFGLLRGYVPHWDAIFNYPPDTARDQEVKAVVRDLLTSKDAFTSNSGDRSKAEEWEALCYGGHAPSAPSAVRLA